MKPTQTALALMLAMLAGHFHRAAAITFDEWRATNFTPNELADIGLSGYTADPDADGRSNWMEFGLNTDPMVPDGLGWPEASLDEDGHLTLGFSRWVQRPGVVYIPQVTDDLRQRWKSGPAHLPEIDVTALDPQSDFVTVRDVEATTTGLQRFVRLMIAIDSDGDGLPDDWEIHNGLNPFDSTDINGDIDGDGVSNVAEFANGTDPLLPPAPPPLQTLPAAPSDVHVITADDGGRLFYWTSNSNNEDYFVIRETRPDGSIVELGRVGPGVTSFYVPPTQP